MSGVELRSMVSSGADNPAYLNDGTPGYVSGAPAENTSVDITDSASDGLKHRHTINGTSVENSDDDGKMEAQAKGADDDSDLNGCARAVNLVQSAIITFFDTHQKIIIRFILIVLLLLYLAYVAYAMYYSFGDEGSLRLLVCTLIGIALLLLHLCRDHIHSCCGRLTSNLSSRSAQTFRSRFKWVLYFVSVVAMVTLLIVLVALDTPKNLVSLGGLAAFIFIAWVTSINPARVNWHPVFWGFSLQFYFAVIILKWRAGYEAFRWLGDRVSEFLAYSDEGAAFVFGDNFRVHYFAFALLPVIVFFSSVISVMYYLGVMQNVVAVLGRFLAFCLNTSPAESINAAGNIFVGQTEAPLMIRPFIQTMTKSELHAVMTGGFATIAGSVLGAYIGFGVPANHLLSASVMSAPAALAISKLTYPETEKKPESDEDEYSKLQKGSDRNIIEAASSGASSAILLVANVAVNVMAFLAILKFINATLTWFGDRVGVNNLTFQFLCSYVLYPVALFMGTEEGLDCRRVAELVGIKTFTNEFIAYKALQKLMDNRKLWLNYTLAYDVNDPANVAYDDLDISLTQWNVVLEKGFLTPRSEVIATYALCGFANVGSMGIMLGGLSALAPERKPDMASIVFRAMIAGNIACFFTACIAGLFYEEYM